MNISRESFLQVLISHIHGIYLQLIWCNIYFIMYPPHENMHISFIFRIFCVLYVFYACVICAVCVFQIQIQYLYVGMCVRVCVCICACVAMHTILSKLLYMHVCVPMPAPCLPLAIHQSAIRTHESIFLFAITCRLVTKFPV